MADAWSSSTSYYSGRRDGEGDDSGPPIGVTGANTLNSAYSPRAGGYQQPYDSGRGRRTAGPYDSSYDSPYERPSDSRTRMPQADSDAPPITRSQRRRQVRQRGLAGWLALLVMLAIAGVGGVIDLVSGTSIRGGFDIGLVIASIVAILLVRHRDMFPIVVAPPLVYVVAYGVVLYIRSGGLHNRKILTDSAANLLVYGFPAIAGASAAVLIIAGIRMVLGK